MATIGGYPTRKLIRNCYLSALFGTSAGLVYKQLKKEPERIQKIVAYASISGGAGLLLGSCYGYYFKRRISLSAMKGTWSFFLVSGTFLGVKEAVILSEVVKNEVGSMKKLRFLESLMSGTVTGFLVGSLWWRNPINFFVTAAGFGALTATGQLISDRFDRWRLHKAVLLKYPELVELEWHAMGKEEQETMRKKQQGWIPWSVDKLQDRPYLGKLKLKQEALSEELLVLQTEENELRKKLGLEIEVGDNFESSSEGDAG